MKKVLFLLFILFNTVNTFSQLYTVSGGVGMPPKAYDEDLAGTGIEKVYLLNTLQNATISYSSQAFSVTFYRYKRSLADKKPVPKSDITESSSGGVTTYVVANLLDGYGYFVEEDKAVRSAVWIIDYSKHLPQLNSISIIEHEDRCENLKLLVSKSDELNFYANNGSVRSVRREYTLSYDKLVWKEDQKAFVTERIDKALSQVGTEILLDAPLLDTKFNLKGDQFAAYFNLAKEVSTPLYKAVATKAYIDPIKEERDSPNEKPDEGNTTIGGSAPVTINFKGYANESVVNYYSWFIYNKKDLNNPLARYTDKNITYTFEQSGEYLVLLEVADRESFCVDSTSVSFSVSESFLDVPNYFSPGDSPGSNDEFRVAYRSLVRFKCTIFNRWGTKLYEWTDPAKGWDGRYKGSFVNTGVYYYVIDAEGSDGVRYKRGGDINILRSR